MRTSSHTRAWVCVGGCRDVMYCLIRYVRGRRVVQVHKIHQLRGLGVGKGVNSYVKNFIGRQRRQWANACAWTLIILRMKIAACENIECGFVIVCIDVLDVFGACMSARETNKCSVFNSSCSVTEICTTRKNSKTKWGMGQSYFLSVYHSTSVFFFCLHKNS